MPSNQISEKDITSAEPLSANDNVALIPGTATNAVKGEQGTFETVSEFNKFVGSDEESVSAVIARYLLNLGMTVHYVVVDDLSELDEYDTFWEQFEDRGLYNLRFLTTAGYVTEAAAQNAIKCAAVRGDAIALIDMPEPSESASLLTADEALAWVKALKVDNITRWDGTVENPFKYAAAFIGNVTFKGESSYLPASFAYLSCFAKHINRFPSWFAMAGSIRGVMPFQEVDTDLNIGDRDASKLQKRTVKEGETFQAINPIQLVRPYGRIVYGNRTLYPIGIANDTDEIQYGLTASSFLNVRNLVCDLKKTIYRAGRKYAFDPNSDVLWTNFTGAIKPLLDEMRSAQGIRGYKIEKVTLAEKATLAAKITIIPIEAVEDFDITIELGDQLAVSE